MEYQIKHDIVLIGLGWINPWWEWNDLLSSMPCHWPFFCGITHQNYLSTDIFLLLWSPKIYLIQLSEVTVVNGILFQNAFICQGGGTVCSYTDFCSLLKHSLGYLEYF